MPFLIRIRKLSKERQKRLNDASKFLKINAGLRRKQIERSETFYSEKGE